MQTAMDLEYLLNTVIANKAAQQDFVASTEQAVYMSGGDDHAIKLNLLNPETDFLQQFGITENAHKQIATRLKIPTRYYMRLLADHPDLVLAQVNALFEREPQSRMLRTLNGNLRAFLSSSYRRLDNDMVLENTLPAIIHGDIETKLLSSNVTDKKMYLKVLFTDDRLSQEIGTVATGAPDIIRPGFILSNSEIGQGSLSVKGFFYRSFCENGCHFGGINAIDFSRSHLGGRVIEGQNFSIISDETKQLENQAVISQTGDIIKALADPVQVQKMGDSLRATKDTEQVINPVDAVDELVQTFNIREGEKDSILESFIKDKDYSLWGMANAVTEQANNSEACSYDRATELEEIGGKVLSMTQSQWGRIAQAQAA